MATKKTEKHTSKKGGKGGYSYSVNLKSPSKNPADRLTAKQTARKEAKNTVVQIGRARPTDVEFPIRVSKKTREGLLKMADGNGVVKITEEDLMTAVKNYLRPKAEEIMRTDLGDGSEIRVYKGEADPQCTTTPSCKAEAPNIFHFKGCESIPIAEVGIVNEGNKIFSEIPFDPSKAESSPKILDIAKEIIHGDREQAYGDPRFNLDTIAQLWSVYLQRLFYSWGIDGAELKAEDVSQMMILLKTARLIHNPTHKDSLVDQAGYAALQGRINGL